MDETWCCWYRFVNGGRDLHSRPGRFVILCAFIRRENLKAWDWSGILESTVFRDHAATVPPCPMPQPASLAMDYLPSPVVTAPERLSVVKERGSLELEGANALQQAGELCASLDFAPRFHCEIVRLHGTSRVKITVTRPAAKVAPPVDLRDTPRSPTTISTPERKCDVSGRGTPGVPWRYVVAFVVVSFIFGTLCGMLIRDKRNPFSSNRDFEPSRPANADVPFQKKAPLLLPQTLKPSPMPRSPEASKGKIAEPYRMLAPRVENKTDDEKDRR